jgi:hypothetical protein
MEIFTKKIKWPAVLIIGFALSALLLALEVMFIR